MESSDSFGQDCIKLCENEMVLNILLLYLSGKITNCVHQ
jgi:hypothetical protein